ncbi:hypothetical protein UK12_36095, partial [Saccharothrix sp. ST-888]
VEQTGQRRTVGHITRGHRDGRTQPGQLITQFGITRRIQTTTARQQQLPGTVTHQPARNLRTQRTRTTRHQHRAA